MPVQHHVDEPRAFPHPALAACEGHGSSGLEPAQNRANWLWREFPRHVRFLEPNRSRTALIPERTPSPVYV